MQPIEQLAEIIPALCDTVDRIDVDQLANPTPCDRFTVHDVLDHMMVGGSGFAQQFRGAAARSASPTPVYGRVPAVEFRAAMSDLLAAVGSPGAMERTIDSPFGALAGDTFARLVAFDGTIHGWDLAVATGKPFRLPESVVEAVDGFARDALADDFRDGDTFKHPTEPPAMSSTIDRLAAFSGRTVRVHVAT